MAGAQAHFRYVNDEGGINGRKLPWFRQTAAMIRRRRKRVSEKLTAQTVGTPTAVKYVPLAESHQIPLVGLFTGAQTLYTPLRR